MSLKLEVGKTYETERGKKRHVIARVPVNPITGNPDDTPYKALDGNGLWWSHREDGTHGAAGQSIVREHVPPPTPIQVLEELIEYPKAVPYCGPKLQKIIDLASVVLKSEKAKVGQ